VIRVLVVDDHPAVRAGLVGVLRSEPGLVPVGEAATAAEVWPMVYRARPDLVLLDYQLGDEDGLVVCRKLKMSPSPPRVVIYSAFADERTNIPAAVAGADAVVAKDTPVHDLFEVLRCAAGGKRTLARPPRDVLVEAAERLDESDLPLLSMFVDGAHEAEIAETMGMSREDVADAASRMLRRLSLRRAARG
jgi:DNA-binding NarL/FixJ family response regulator